MSERRLRNAAAPQVALVESVDELLDAIAAGTTNIEILQHLDLRLGEDGSVDDYGIVQPVLSFIPLSVRTIRGNCTQPPPQSLLPEADDDTPGVFQMLPMLEHQCLVLVDTALLQAEGRLWLDGLYVRLQRPHSSSAFVITVWPGNAPRDRGGLWMTDVTLQSDSGPHFEQDAGLTWGVQVFEVNMLAQDCTFANLGGEAPVSAVDVISARADFVDCAFRDNYMGGPDEGVIQGINNASIALHRPSFSGNFGDGHLLHFDPYQEGQVGWAEGVQNRVKYFSDDPALVDYCQNRDGLQPMQPLALSDTNLAFMQSWLERKQEELGIIQRPLPAEASSSALKANNMGCCNINCFDYDYASPPLTVAIAVAPQQAPQLAPVEAPQQGLQQGPQQSPQQGPQPASVPAPSTVAAAAGRNETKLPAAADAAPSMFTQQPVGAPDSPPGSSDSSERGAAGQGPGAVGPPPTQADDGLGVGSSVAIALGVILVALLVFIGAFVWWRRQRCGGKADLAILDTSASKESEPLAAVDSAGSISFGPHLGGVPQHAQHISETSRTAEAAAAAAAGAAGTSGDSAGVDAAGVSGSRGIAGASGSGEDRGGAVEPTLPELEPAGSIGSMNATTVACTTASNDAEPTQAIASRVVRSGEVVPQADMELVRDKTATVSSDAASGSAGRNEKERQKGSSAGGGEAMGSTARMRAMFHQPTELGTLDETDAWRTLAGRAQDEPPQLAEGATGKERLAFIGSQLDAFGRRGVILDQYEMLGGDDRCQGGQAVVQFVRAPQNNHIYAIKLFASRAAYDDEKHLYLHYFPTFMPTVVQFVDNEDGKFRDPLGAPMPPCFVMEKGESLTERIMRCKNDIFTTIQIIGQVASCLAQLHSQGWVHRDLKPGNIMFLPRTGSWTLIDFGLAARAGEDARIGFTPSYAAPEVVAAHAAGDESVTADPAVDAWALGVIAFELLSRMPAFDALSAPGDVERQLLGADPLPWEGDRLTPAAERRLGNIKAPVLRMLCRDPAERASCKQLASSLRAVFTGGGTTVEQPAEVPA